MIEPVHYSVRGRWTNRIESDEEVAKRLIQFLALLRPIDTLLGKWSYVDPEGACFDYEEWDRFLIDIINGRVAKGQFNEPRPELGFRIIAVNTPDVTESPQTVWIDGYVGGRIINTVSVTTSFHVNPDPRLIRYPVLRQVLLAVYDVFAPDYVYAAPSDLKDRATIHSENSLLPRCWMIKLSPPLAKSVVPPASVISEVGDDGSLFMSATDQTFVTANPAHVAGARAIEDVLDPLEVAARAKI